MVSLFSKGGKKEGGNMNKREYILKVLNRIILILFLITLMITILIIG